MEAYSYIAAIGAIGLAAADIFTKKVFSNKYICAAAFVALSTIFLTGGRFAAAPLWSIGTVVLSLYFFIRINLFPIGKKGDIPLPAHIIMGGRRLLYYGLFMALIQLLIWPNINKAAGVITLSITNKTIAQQLALTISVTAILLLNGFFRIFCLSKRLRVFRRIFILCTLWIPVFNIFLLLYLCHMAYLEYDHACYKVENARARIDSSLCSTKYPILLLHGVGFRDFKYINYWGRIPKELVRNGASVFYGHQEAWGSVRENSQDICKRIKEITAGTGCAKINIVAHSKGGLDARYVISSCGMAPYVASLTTIGTPHRGCRFVDIACKIPERIHRAIAKTIDKYYKKIGDANPDFYTATKQFTTTYLTDFNNENPDSPNVYYQSYTSVMKGFFSDFLLCIPYCIIKSLEGENDGLVSVFSAQWGNFKGVFRNKHRRGISHGDIIDLKREDYKGFDVAETYVSIISALKEMGF